MQNTPTTMPLFQALFNARCKAVSAANQLENYITAMQAPIATLGEAAKARAFLDYDVEYQLHAGITSVHGVSQVTYLVIPTRRGWVAVDVLGDVVFSEHYATRLDRYFDTVEVATIKDAIAKAVVCGLSLKGLLIYLDNCDNRPMDHYFHVMDHMKVADLMTDGELATEISRQKLLA